MTPLTQELIQAIYSRNRESVKASLDKGATVNVRIRLKTKGSRGWTPLMVAAQIGDVSIVEMILRYGPDIDARNKEGDAARDIAQKAGHSDIVKWLDIASAGRIEKANK